jgi:hypothetical protein
MTNSKYEPDFELPEPVAEFLSAAVKIAKTDDALSVHCKDQTRENNPIVVLDSKDGNIKIKVHPLPFASLEIREFLTCNHVAGGNEYDIHFPPKAFKWAEYQKMNGIQKCIVRNPVTLRDGAVLVSLILSIASIILTTAKIVQIFPLTP